MKYYLGLDIGSKKLLRAYQQARQLKNWQMIAATDLLNRYFSRASNFLPKLSALAFKTIEHNQALKERIIKYAMGLN